MELPPLLTLCMEVEAWGVAAHICRDRSLYPQAFHYHLRELSRSGQGQRSEHREELQASAAAATKYYLGYVNNNVTSLHRRSRYDVIRSMNYYPPVTTL